MIRLKNNKNYNRINLLRLIEVLTLLTPSEIIIQHSPARFEPVLRFSCEYYSDTVAVVAFN